MRNHLLTLASVLALLLLSGCQVWKPGGSAVTGKDGAYTVTPPAGWMYAENQARTDLIASKEGLVLQNLAITHRDLTKPLENSKRKLAATMTPFELAEAVAGELRANHDLLGFELRENAPATVGGRPGFKLVFSYHTKDRLTLTEARYGAISGKDLWLISFTAPSRHYYELDLPTFEATVKSLTLGKP